MTKLLSLRERGFARTNRSSKQSRGRVAVAAVVLALAGSPSWLAGQGNSKEAEGRNFDARVSQNQGYQRAPRASQLQAVDRIRQQRPALIADFDAWTGATRKVFNGAGALTGPNRGASPQQACMSFLYSNADLLGLDVDDMQEYEVTDSVYSSSSGATHIYLSQRHQGLATYNGQLHVNVDRHGAVVSVNNAFMPEIRSSVNANRPNLDAAEAVESALGQIGLRIGTPDTVTGPQGVEHFSVVDHKGISLEPIEARLMWLPVRNKQVRLVWNFLIQTLDKQHAYDFTVDARNGKVWTRFDLVTSDSYRVYARPSESPNHSGRTLVSNPADAGPSPLGWHNTGSTSFTIMRGNNVHAYDDRDANNQPPATQPSCGASLNCDFAINLANQPSTYTSAAIANLFYWNNILHDTQYRYGFDEASGNFQVNNFGKGGAGNDDVRAEAQDAGGTNNANFFTPVDGSRPRMQMFEWTLTNPRRDGDLDNGIVAHEYGHGISTRQVGGPNNSSCLNNSQQPGEGWSDYIALMYTMKAGDLGTDGRGIGTYSLGQPISGNGIRTQRYSTSPTINSHTYASIQGMAIPHGVGEVWGQALWEVTWALIDKHGFGDLANPDFTNPSTLAGNQRAMFYVNEGFKNTACSPTFLDARDGILQAVANNFGGEDLCDVWTAFAAFGLGSNASTPGPNSTSATNGFNIPPGVCGPPPPSSCPTGSINFSSFTLQSYSNQDAGGSVTVEDGGDTLLMTGNTWKRSATSFNVTPNTVVEFQFRSTSQGEIHGLGFDENQTLADAKRIFQFWGTQNWADGIPFTPGYNGSGNFQTFTIPVGLTYTGSSMRLVFTNDKDAGVQNNNGRFKCVRIFEDTGGGAPSVIFEDGFEAGAPGWTKTSGATDLWRLAGDCVSAASGATTLAFSRSSPNCDYDVGTALGTVTSPVINTSGFATVTLEFQHFWQTESFAGTFDRMFIEVSNNGGVSWSLLKEINSSNANPSAYVSESFSISASTQTQVRFRFDSVDGVANDFAGWYIDNFKISGL